MKKEPPASFGIRVEETLDGTSYSWKDQESAPAKFRRVAVHLLFACVAFCFALFVLSRLASGSEEVPPYFHWIVFGVCIVMVLSNLFVAYSTIKGRKPFVLTLSLGSIRYEMGTISKGTIDKEALNIRSLNEAITVAKKYMKRNLDMEISKVANLRLESIGEQQRLYLDYEGETCEIGPTLSGPEREWLYELLREHSGMS